MNRRFEQVIVFSSRFVSFAALNTWFVTMIIFPGFRKAEHRFGRGTDECALNRNQVEEKRRKETKRKEKKEPTQTRN